MGGKKVESLDNNVLEGELIKIVFRGLSLPLFIFLKVSNVGIDVEESFKKTMLPLARKMLGLSIFAEMLDLLNPSFPPPPSTWRSFLSSLSIP